MGFQTQLGAKWQLAVCVADPFAVFPGKKPVRMQCWWEEISAPFGILTKILYPSRPWPTALNPGYFCFIIIINIIIAIELSLGSSSSYTSNK